MAKGYIYIGGFQPTADVLFVKAGRSGSVRERIKGYRTMLPGGLTFMHVGRAEESNRAEGELLARVAAIEGVSAVGGEWFRCHPLLKNAVVDELKRIAPGAAQVNVGRPIPFGEQTPGKRSRGRIARRKGW